MKTDAIRRRHEKLGPPQLEKIEQLPRLMLTAYFDLRGDKSAVVRETPLCTHMMMFLNKRCSLAHIVWAADVGDPDYKDGTPHRREPIPKRLWGAHPEFIRRWVLKKLILRGIA